MPCQVWAGRMVAALPLVMESAWMGSALDRIEGRKFCVVFMKVLDLATEKVQLQCLHGRASIEGRKVVVYGEGGASFTLPSTCLNKILPSDGSPMLKDAEYYCIVRLDDGIDLVSPRGEDFFQ